jgi:hypothetical protein
MCTASKLRQMQFQNRSEFKTCKSGEKSTHNSYVQFQQIKHIQGDDWVVGTTWVFSVTQHHKTINAYILTASSPIHYFDLSCYIPIERSWASLYPTTHKAPLRTSLFISSSFRCIFSSWSLLAWLGGSAELLSSIYSFAYRS